MWTAIGVGGAALLGGAMSADASKSASNAQTASAGQSIAEQRRQYDQTRADNSQFLGTGTQANRRLSMLLGLPSSGPDQNDPRFKAIYDPMVAGFDQSHQARFGMSAFDPRADAASRDATLGRFKQLAGDQYTQQYGDNTSSDPAYGSLLKKFSSSDLAADPVYQSGLQFGADQGAGAINARATAGGMYDSGATLKALTRFGNDYGSTKANESYNRFTNDQNNTFNRLSGASGTGQVATNQVASAGSSMANNVSNDLTGAGNSRAAGIVGGANAWGGAANNASMAANNYQSNQRLMALLQNRGGSGGSAYGPSSSDYGYYSGYTQ